MSSSTALTRTTSQSDQSKSVTNINRSASQLSRPSPRSITASPRSSLDLTSRASQTQPQTPVKSSSFSSIAQSPSAASPIPSTPGKWQHPRLDEVVRRQEKTRFDRDNVAVLTRNTLLMVGSFAIPRATEEYLITLPRLLSLTTWPLWIVWLSIYSTLWAFRLLLIANAGIALAPLFRTPDACEDIPLDPSQRKLLGLPPMSRPATPLEKEQWVTPPRFSRNNTPLSATNSLRANPSQSPSVPFGSPLGTPKQVSGSPFSPGTLGTSHLGGQDARRRLSYTSTRSSPLSLSEFDMVGSLATPTKNGRASVALNNKWLYEKGWVSSRGSLI